jgi:hypothetical protein
MCAFGHAAGVLSMCGLARWSGKASRAGRQVAGRAVGETGAVDGVAADRRGVAQSSEAVHPPHMDPQPASTGVPGEAGSSRPEFPLRCAADFTNLILVYLPPDLLFYLEYVHETWRCHHAEVLQVSL